MSAVLESSLGSAITEWAGVPYAALHGDRADCFPLDQDLAYLAVASSRDQLLVEHLPMVRSIARSLKARLPKHIELEDLVSAGTLGLVDALEKFDEARGVQFRSYAQFRVRGAMMDALRHQDWSPRDLRRKARAAEQSIQNLTMCLGRTPHETEIAADMQMSLTDYRELLSDLKSLELGSLNVERNAETGDEELAYVPGPAEQEPLFQCLQAELREHLIEAVEDLPERDRLVLTLYYFEELTLKEIGVTLGVVESRVSQIRTSAVLRLRAALSSASGRRKGQPARACRR